MTIKYRVVLFAASAFCALSASLDRGTDRADCDRLWRFIRGRLAQKRD